VTHQQRSQVLVDTSAFYAVLDRDDSHHPQARGLWAGLLDREAALVTTNYIVVETCALVQNRLGLDAVRTFWQDMLPVVEVRWIGPELHSSAMLALLAANRRKLSLVDCANFLVMRAGGIRRAFAFDQHYREQGFEMEKASTG
jgi:predicted nucleic acid-binding protein